MSGMFFGAYTSVVFLSEDTIVKTQCKFTSKNAVVKSP